MLYNMLYIHFFRNVIEKPQINQFKIFRKCFVLPGIAIYKRVLHVDRYVYCQCSIDAICIA